MNTESDPYYKREHSYIKHCFLAQYLEIAAFKILQSGHGQEVFNFIDGFAGPWQTVDDDYTDASFDQAMRTLENVRINLIKKIPKIKIRFCFCERDKKSYERLCEYAKKYKNTEIKLLHGDFENHLGEIADFCQIGFTFTFIDPTGWNIDSKRIFEFLKDRKGEFLLNFMEEPINRHAGYQKVEDSFSRFLDDPDWKDDFDAFSEEMSNEERVLSLLKNKIKTSGVSEYVPDFPIYNPRKQRIKMRLILGTNNPKGLEVFRNVQHKVEQEAIKTKNEVRNGTLQQSLYSVDEIVAMEQKISGIGSQQYVIETEKRIIEILTEEGPTDYGAISADILENIPMRLTNINSLSCDMKKQGRINFDLPGRARVPKEDTIIALSKEGVSEK